MIASIRAVGVAVDRAAAERWVLAVAEVLAEPGEFVVAPGLGVGGHELALLDFDEADSAVPRLRRLGELVRTSEASDLQVAVAVAGSTAQLRIQPFPADVDFFERVHIAAPSREAAARRLAELVRSDALRDDLAPGLRLEDVLFGQERDGRPVRWEAAEIAAGNLAGAGDGRANDQPLTWTAAAADPGLVKVSWFLLDRGLGGPGWVSKVIDATWEGADGIVRSLDGAIDAEFQQVYLDAGGAELARRLTSFAGATERERYVQAMEREVLAHRRATPPNHGKAVKRLYNLCRLTDRRTEALYLRELFDDPAARLYEAQTMIRALIRQGGDDLLATLPLRRALLAELMAAVGTSSVGTGPTWSTVALAEALDACWTHCPEDEPSPVATTEVARALRDLDSALGAYVDALFAHRLRAFPPIVRLLAEIEGRRSRDLARQP